MFILIFLIKIYQLALEVFLLCTHSIYFDKKERKKIRSTFANSEDPDEMQHNASFHQGLHCLYMKKDLQTREYNIFFENYNLKIITPDTPRH